MIRLIIIATVVLVVLIVVWGLLFKIVMPSKPNSKRKSIGISYHGPSFSELWWISFFNNNVWPK